MREDSSLVIESIPMTDISSVHAHDEEAHSVGEDINNHNCTWMMMLYVNNACMQVYVYYMSLLYMINTRVVYQYYVYPVNVCMKYMFWMYVYEYKTLAKRKDNMKGAVGRNQPFLNQSQTLTPTPNP